MNQYHKTHCLEYFCDNSIWQLINYNLLDSNWFEITVHPQVPKNDIADTIDTASQQTTVTSHPPCSCILSHKPPTIKLKNIIHRARNVITKLQPVHCTRPVIITPCDIQPLSWLSHTQLWQRLILSTVHQHALTTAVSDVEPGSVPEEQDQPEMFSQHYVQSLRSSTFSTTGRPREHTTWWGKHRLDSHLSSWRTPWRPVCVTAGEMTCSKWVEFQS